MICKFDCINNGKKLFKLRNVIDKDEKNSTNKKKIFRVIVFQCCLFIRGRKSVYIFEMYLFAEQQFHSKKKIKSIYLCYRISFCCLCGLVYPSPNNSYIPSPEPLLEYTKLVKCYYKIAFLFNCTHGMCNFHWYISK